jgi:hypothetical protein
MALGRDAMRHAGGIYRKVLPRLRHPAREIAAEVEHLRELERSSRSSASSSSCCQSCS